MSDKTNGKENIRKTTKKFNVKEWIVILVLIILIIALVQVKRNTNNSSTENGVVDSTNSVDNTTISYVQEAETGVKLNTSSELNSPKEIDGILISNIQLTTKNGMSTLLADCTNNNDTKTEVKSVEITFVDKDGNDLVTLTGVIEPLEPGQTLQLNLSMTSDYIEAYDFTITEK